MAQDPTPDADIEEKFKTLSKVIEDASNLIYNIIPNRTFFVLSHLDNNILNFLCSKDKSHVFILDHEFAQYCFMGIDIISFMVEAEYLLISSNTKQCSKYPKSDPPY